MQESVDGPWLAVDARTRVDPWPVRIRWLAIGLTIALHAWLLDVLRTPPVRSSAPGDPLVVVLIEEHRPPPPPMPQAPRRPASAPAAAPRLRAVEVPASPADPAADDSDYTVAVPRLFDAQARPLLPAAPADREYGHPASMPRDARVRPRLRLPGSAEPIVDIGEVVRDPLSPQQVVQAIGALIGLGRGPTDSCDKVEGRLLSETHAVVREIDLHAFEKRCRGLR
jgi:hypothetical protein